MSKCYLCVIDKKQDIIILHGLKFKIGVIGKPTLKWIQKTRYLFNIYIISISCVAALLKRTFNTQCIVFMQTKRQAHRMHILLGLMGVNVGELHGNLSQLQVL